MTTKPKETQAGWAARTPSLPFGNERGLCGVSTGNISVVPSPGAF